MTECVVKKIADISVSQRDEGCGLSGFVDLDQESPAPLERNDGGFDF